MRLHYNNQKFFFLNSTLVSWNTYYLQWTMLVAHTIISYVLMQPFILLTTIKSICTNDLTLLFLLSNRPSLLTSSC